MANVLRKEQFILPEGRDLSGWQLAGADAERRACAGFGCDERRMGADADPRLEQGRLDGAAANVGTSIGRSDRGAAGSVVMGDTLSVKVYQALAAALKMRPERRVILSDKGNFPSDLYMAEGLVGLLEQGYELRTVAPEDVATSIDDEVAVVMLTEVDYRTGRKHDMKAMTEVGPCQRVR